MESWSHARLAQQQQVRLASLASDAAVGLGHTPPQELPPLRDTPTIRSNSAMSPLARLGELDFTCDPLRDTLRRDLKTPSRLGLRTSGAQSNAPGRLGQFDVRSELSEDSTGGFEVEQLKRQVARLTQLRRDRDSYIQELLGEAEAAQKRHESEIARRTVKSQREVAEQLAAQQREHDLHLEERSKAHAAALAQQAWNHECEIGEFRRSQRADNDRRLAEKLNESATHHRNMLVRLQSSVEDLRQRLASHTAALGDASGDSPTAASGAITTVARPGAQQASDKVGGTKPELEEASIVPGGKALELRGAMEEVALAERAVDDAAKAVEWAIVLASKDLERTLAASTAHVASSHEVHHQESAKFQREVLESTARLERMGCRSREWAATASSAWSATLLLKVVLVWRNEVRRLSSLSAEQQRMLQKRQQRQPLVLARIKDDTDYWLRIVLRTWVAIAGHARREVSIEQGIERCKEQIAELKSHLRSKSVAMIAAETLRLQQSVLRAWASHTVIVHCSASHQDEFDRALKTWEAERTSILMGTRERIAKACEVRKAQGLKAIEDRILQCETAVFLSWASLVVESKLQASCEKQLEEKSAEHSAALLQTKNNAAEELSQLRRALCKQRRDQGFLAVEASLQRTQNVVLLAWKAVTAESKRDRAHAQELADLRKSLRMQHRALGLTGIQASLDHFQRLALRAWRAQAVAAHSEAAGASQLERAVAEAAAQQDTMRREVDLLRVELRKQLRTQGLRLARVHTKGQLHASLFRWIVATREARREATHRHQLITAKADASAEIYKLRNEVKKVALELRKQRRAHGVAAIHASLDRRLQSVLLAWATVVRDGQRESAYQRQLDIAAAESAAGCAVLRMEGRRCTLELREQRRNQALRAIEVGLRYWQHLVLREWAAGAVLARHEALHAQQLGLAVARVEAETASKGQIVDAGQNLVEAQKEYDSETGALVNVAQLLSGDALQPAASTGMLLATGSSTNTAAAHAVERLQAEREELQTQITKLHDELRRHHGSLP